MRYLRKNMVVLLERRPHRIVLVNECRALCVPLAKRQIVVKPLAGRAVTFERSEAGISISPASEVQVLGVWRDGTVTTPTGQQIPEGEFKCA